MRGKAYGFRQIEASGCFAGSQQRYVTPLAEALAAIGLEDFDLAFQRLDEAINHRINIVDLLAVKRFFQPLRNDHRFTNF